MQKRILIVEDEDAIRGFILLNLKKARFQAFEANCGENALEFLLQNPSRVDIVLLDVMMPGIDGIETAKRIREAGISIGIIMLTAKAEEADLVSGLAAGADDYITKPFSPSELIARIDALHRRMSISSPKERLDEIVSGEFVLSTKRRTLECKGIPIDLTSTEYQIMEFLIINEGHAVSRKQIGSRVWGEGYLNEEKIIDVNIRRLRMKLEEDPSNPKYIETVWGKGYLWNPQTTR